MALGSTACRDRDDVDIVRAEVGPSGATVVSADSVLTIAILPGALEETIELTIQRTDEPPRVFGPAYQVSPNVDLAIPATVSYRYPLPEDTSQTAVGYVDPEEYAEGAARWLPLALGRLDVERDLVTGLDPQISLFYALLDDAVDVPPNPTTTDGPGTGDGTTGGEDSGTTGNVDSGSTVTDPDTSVGPTTDPTDPTDPTTTGPGESSGETTDGTTGGGLDCGNLPAGPLMVDEFIFDGTPLDGNAEDMTFSSVGSIIVRNGADLVQISPAGTVTNIPTMVALPDTLGLRWRADGNIVANSLTTNEILLIEPTGAVSQLWGGLNIPNGIYPSVDGNYIFFTDFTIPQAAYIDNAGTMLTELGLGGVEAPQANGIIYDPDRDFVYYVSYGPGILWRVDVTDLANPGDPQNILTIGPTAMGDLVGLDGLAMDACGNLYIVDQNQGAPGSLFRVELDVAGDPVGAAELLVETFPDGVANAVFGQGPGWEAYDTTLFVVGLPGRIFMVDVGVPGAPTAVTG